jgi:hypothetical protein
MQSVGDLGDQNCRARNGARLMNVLDLIGTIDERARKLLLEVAVHESGHSVISRVLGLPSGRATLRDSDGNARSYSKHDGGLKTVLTCLAGRAATEVLLGYASDPGCAVDDDKSVELLEANGFRDSFYAFDVKMALLADAHALIRKRRGKVALVALGLLAKRTLTASEIDQLIEET